MNRYDMEQEMNRKAEPIAAGCFGLVIGLHAGQSDWAGAIALLIIFGVVWVVTAFLKRRA